MYSIHSIDRIHSVYSRYSIYTIYGKCNIHIVYIVCIIYVVRTVGLHLSSSGLAPVFRASHKGRENNRGPFSFEKQLFISSWQAPCIRTNTLTKPGVPARLSAKALMQTVAHTYC